MCDCERCQKADKEIAKIDAARSVVQPVVMPVREIKSELIRIAALMATCYSLPSDLVDDYPQKTYSAARVAGMMSKAHEHSKMMAYQLRQAADKIKA